MVLELKKVELDEIELALELLKANTPEEINNATYKEIANLIETNFNIVCSLSDIMLLHEPTIDEDRISLEIHYKVLGLI